MGSVASTNPGLVNLTQILSNINSPVLSAALNSQALQNASPADIIALSDQAMEFQQIEGLFGGSVTATVGSSGSLLDSLAASALPSSMTIDPSAPVTPSAPTTVSMNAYSDPSSIAPASLFSYLS